MFRFLLLFALLIPFGCEGETKTVQSPPIAQPSNFDKLKTAFAYLGEIPEITWYEFDDRNVYIGFQKSPTIGGPAPEDWDVITKGAALKGNKAIDAYFHSWATIEPKGWRPDKPGQFWEFDAKGGRIVKD